MLNALNEVWALDGPSREWEKDVWLRSSPQIGPTASCTHAYPLFPSGNHVGPFHSGCLCLAH